MARKVHVWRVQNSASLGPYWSGDFGNVFDTGDRIERSPSPANDGGLGAYLRIDYDKRKEFFFGFRSPRQMRSWFDAEERRWLTNNGFKVVRFTVSAEHVIHGNQQTVFRRDRAVTQYERPITRRAVRKIGKNEARSYQLSLPPGFDKPVPPIGELQVPF